MEVDLAAAAVVIVTAFYRRELTKASNLRGQESRLHEAADRVTALVFDVIELMVKSDPPTRSALQSLRSNPDDDSAQRVLIDRLAQAAALHPSYRRALDDAVRGITSTSDKADQAAAQQQKSRFVKTFGGSSAQRWTVIAGVMAVFVPLVSLVTWIIGSIADSPTQPTPSYPPPTQSRSTAASSPATAGRDPSAPTALEVARSKCAPSSNRVRLGDGGYTLIIDRAVAKENPGIDRKALDCIFDELDVPDSVVSHVENTTPSVACRRRNSMDFPLSGRTTLIAA